MQIKSIWTTYLKYFVTYILDYVIFVLILNNFAAGLGIEPKFSLSESDVLPLDDPAIHIKYIKN